MERSILVAYATKSGSTAEVAEAVGKALRESGAKVDVRPARDVAAIGSYDAVIVGSPVLNGNPHREAAGFLQRHQEDLSTVPVACFLTCLELTKTGQEKNLDIPIYTDPLLGRPPAAEGRLSFFEKTHFASAFLAGLLKNAPQIKPVSVGIFRGKLDYSKLDWVSRLGMRLIRLIYKRAPEGDFRNWQAIRSWAKDLPPTLLPPDLTATPHGRTDNFALAQAAQAKRGRSSMPRSRLGGGRPGWQDVKIHVSCLDFIKWSLTANRTDTDTGALPSAAYRRRPTCKAGFGTLAPRRGSAVYPAPAAAACYAGFVRTRRPTPRDYHGNSFYRGVF